MLTGAIEHLLYEIFCACVSFFFISKPIRFLVFKVIFIQRTVVLLSFDINDADDDDGDDDKDDKDDEDDDEDDGVI